MKPKVGTPRHEPPGLFPLQAMPLTMERLTEQEGAWSAHQDGSNAASFKNPKFATLPQFCVVQVPPPTCALPLTGVPGKLNGDMATGYGGIDSRNGDDVKEPGSNSMVNLMPGGLRDDRCIKSKDEATAMRPS